MATSRKKVDVVVSAKGTQAAKRKLGGVEKSIGSMAKGALAGVASFYALKKALDFTVAASIAQEKIFRKLQTSVELTGKEWGSAKGELDSLFSSLQATTEYGDTESAAVFTTLMQLTGDYNKAVRALPMALDLAATGLFDTGTAAKYISLAMAGNVEMLGRYIPELRAANNEIVKNGTVAEKTAEFMRIFNDKFSGTAQKNLDSVSSQWKQMKNYLGDIGEAAGDKALPAINDLLGGVTDFFKKLSETALETTIRQLKEMGVEAEKLVELQFISDWANATEALIGSEDKIISQVKQHANEYEKVKELTGLISHGTEQIYSKTVGLKDVTTTILDFEKLRNLESKTLFLSMENIRKNLIDQVNFKDGISETEKKIIEDSNKQRNLLGDLLKLTTAKEAAERIILGLKKDQNREDAGAEGGIDNAEKQIVRLKEKIKELETAMRGMGVSLPFTETFKEVEVETEDFLDRYGKTIESAANRFSGALSGAFIQMANDGQFSFILIADAFKRMLIQMAAEYAAKAAIFTLFNLIPGVSIAGGLSKFVFGAAGGADFTVNKPTAIIAGEGGRAEHVRITPAPINNNSASTNNYISAIMDAEAFKMLLRSGGNEVLIGEMAGDRL
jgi:hypothetical protein